MFNSKIFLLRLVHHEPTYHFSKITKNAFKKTDTSPIDGTTLSYLLVCYAMAHFMDVKLIDDELTFVYQVVPYLQGYKGTFNQAHQLSQGCSPHSQFQTPSTGPATRN